MCKKNNEKKKFNEKILKLTLLDKYEYWIWQPEKYWPVDLWYKWGELQTKILGRIQANLPETHVYIRFSTFTPQHYKDVIDSDRTEKIVTRKGRKTITLIADCQDKMIWKSILEGSGMIPYSRCFFMLKEKPTNWEEVITNLYKIIKKFNKRHSLKEYEAAISICRCLCFSLDEDLVIGKVDLPEQTVLGILKELAQEDGLELNIERE